MGCCGDREKGLVDVAADQKWDYIVCLVSRVLGDHTNLHRTSQTSGHRHA